MSSEFNKAFIGYRRKDVIKELDFQKSEFEKLKNECDNELKSLIEENNRLKLEADRAQTESEKQLTISEKIKELLYAAHINACNSVYETGAKFEEMIQYKSNIVRNQQNKNVEIKTSINRLLEHLQRIVD
jgi:hypothetical protein